jgi:V/A-type H+-transporting ATPase subunit E
MNDPHFVSSLLMNVVENWKDCNEDASLEALLPGDLHQTAEEQFRITAGHLLNNGLNLKRSKSISGGFEIRPSNGRYKISFTDEAFEAFLKENFRPVAKTFLFGEGA